MYDIVRVKMSCVNVSTLEKGLSVLFPSRHENIRLPTNRCTVRLIKEYNGTAEYHKYDQN